MNAVFIINIPYIVSVIVIAMLLINYAILESKAHIKALPLIIINTVAGLTVITLTLLRIFAKWV